MRLSESGRICLFGTPRTFPDIREDAWTSTVQASTLDVAVEKLREELREGDRITKVLELP